MPWLTLPFTHALRREQLRQLFEVSTLSDTAVLLHLDGSTILREANLYLKLAYRCQMSINNKATESEYEKSYIIKSFSFQVVNS